MDTHGNMTCLCTPHLYGNDDFKVHDSISVKFKHGDAIPNDFFSVKCKAQDGAEYKNIHSGIAYNSSLHKRHVDNPLPNDAMGVNILMFGFDSTSRMSWMRNLPKSHQYLTHNLGGLVLEGYNIVGDGTPRALLPILCGKTELELPEARRGFKGAQFLDGYPWIWQDFKDIGYVTQWGEDNCYMGTFTRRLRGFKQQPVDHYMQPFCVKAEKQYKQHKPYCLGSLPRHTNMLNWISDFYNMYDKKPRFSFVFHSELTHDAYSAVKVVDDDLLWFLHNMEHKGYLNNTILILMADHGPRIKAVRQTEQGKYEERMPYFSFRFPPWFESKYPEAMHNFHINIGRLTTPFDIHETFMDIIHYKGSRKANVSERGISLFNEIPAERTCADAGVETHWCACLKWQHSISLNDTTVLAAAKKLIDTINYTTKYFRDQCHLLTLGNVTMASQYKPYVDLLKFKRSKDKHARIPDMSGKMHATEIFYQVTIRTYPSGALYEGTVKHYSKLGSFVVDTKQISRINKYGSQPHCIQDQSPHLTPYCYCKEQLMKWAYFILGPFWLN